MADSKSRLAAQLQVPAYYALILRSLTVLEGVALSADRNYKLLAKAYPYMAQRLLTDPNPELRLTFEELMLKGGEFRWNRLEELLQQSRKSQGFSSQQLWLVTDWFLSEQAKQIRDKVTEVRSSPLLCPSLCSCWNVRNLKQHLTCLYNSQQVLIMETSLDSRLPCPVDAKPSVSASQCRILCA